MHFDWVFYVLPHTLCNDLFWANERHQFDSEIVQTKCTWSDNFHTYPCTEKRDALQLHLVSYRDRHAGSIFTWTVCYGFSMVLKQVVQNCKD
jgi:hypothetical protein